VRRPFSLVAGAAVAALGGLILGEYEFEGAFPYVAGVLFGLVVAEVVVSVGAWRGPVPAVASAAFAAGGLAWAAWITSGEGIEPWPALAWVAMALAAGAAAVRAGPRPRRPRAP
jgi:hypothetical protein